jgi:hypothetical protein
MRKRHVFRPSAPVFLEERIALSPSGPAAAAVVSPLVKSLAVSLNGFVLGTDTTVGLLHLLKASGASVAPLTPGQVKLTGSFVELIPFGPKRPVSGVVTLSDPKGSVVVSINGTVAPLGGSLSALVSGTLTYRILGGTGAYLGATGQGKVLYGPGPIPQPGRFLLDFGNATPPP